MTTFARLAVAVLIFSCLTHFTFADEQELGLLPLVREHYSAVYVVTYKEKGYEVKKAYFIRNNKIIAERAVWEEMIWTFQDGKFVLTWCDFGVCRRSVSFDVLGEIPYELIEGWEEKDLPWFAQQVRRTDLAQQE